MRRHGLNDQALAKAAQRQLRVSRFGRSLADEPALRAKVVAAKIVAG
jgi:hypothetical protein